MLEVLRWSQTESETVHASQAAQVRCRAMEATVMKPKAPPTCMHGQMRYMLLEQWRLRQTEAPEIVKCSLPICLGTPTKPSQQSYRHHGVNEV